MPFSIWDSLEARRDTKTRFYGISTSILIILPSRLFWYYQTLSSITAQGTFLMYGTRRSIIKTLPTPLEGPEQIIISRS